MNRKTQTIAVGLMLLLLPTGLLAQKSAPLATFGQKAVNNVPCSDVTALREQPAYAEAAVSFGNSAGHFGQGFIIGLAWAQKGLEAVTKVDAFHLSANVVRAHIETYCTDPAHKDDTVLQAALDLAHQILGRVTAD
jgi:hypothetical protein